MTSLPLYEQTAALRAILDAEDAADYTAALDALEDGIAQKAEAVALYIRGLEAQAEVIRAEEVRLAARRSALENKGARLKDYLKTCLETAQIPQVKTPLITIAIQKNPPAVEVVSERELDDSFKRAKITLPLSQVPEELLGAATVEIDRAGVKAFIAKSGGTVPAGVRLTQQTRVVIR